MSTILYFSLRLFTDLQTLEWLHTDLGIRLRESSLMTPSSRGARVQYTQPFVHLRTWSKFVNFMAGPLSLFRQIMGGGVHKRGAEVDRDLLTDALFLTKDFLWPKSFMRDAQRRYVRRDWSQDKAGMQEKRRKRHFFRLDSILQCLNINKHRQWREFHRLRNIFNAAQ